MTDKSQPVARPAAVKVLGGHALPGKPAGQVGTKPKPRGMGRIMAKARPGALMVPSGLSVSAYTREEVLERWTEEAAGIRPSALAQGDNVITMFDEIGEDFWSGGGVTAKKVSAQLRAIGDRPIEVQINSFGGDMFEGVSIYNVLRQHPQPITMKVMGMAASAASIIAMAGDTIEIGAASFVMIHNCEVVAIGNRHDFRETADFLEPFDGAMAGVYAQRSGQKAEDCTKWMDAETFMNGAQAIERGFADALLPADQITVDEKAKAHDRDLNGVRAMELTLLRAGHSRAEARARINQLKGKPDAAQDPAAKPDAGGTELLVPLAGLLNALR